MPTPTVRRLQLGNELRHLRKRAGKTLAEAAKIIDRSEAVASKLENGSTGIRLNDLVALVNYYAKEIGDDGEPVELDWYLELNKGAVNRGRWTGHRSTYPKWFRMAADLEADASAINIYQAELVHGLLQTENYIRAMFTRAVIRKGDQSTEDIIKARLERQQVLDRDDPPEFAVVLSESAIRRMVGGPEVMREQLTHLAEVADRPHVQLNILPFHCHTTTGVPFPFVQVRVPSAGKNAPHLEYVFVEQYTNADYLDGPADVADYHSLWNGLLGATLNQGESRDLLLRTAEQFR